MTGKIVAGESVLQLKSIMFLKNVHFSLSFLAEEGRLMLPYVATMQISEVTQTVAPDNSVPKLYVVTDMKYILYKHFLN